jgi:hypothetical protein
MVIELSRITAAHRLTGRVDPLEKKPFTTLQEVRNNS